MEKISIQNGDFSILNGENYQWSLFFKKKAQNAFEKMNGEISILNGENSL